ncbi:DUF4251 domain-containing protein [Chryseobacterium arthrosphaerae]|uniref:DUF4251 domain-containing protein n=1 Tax=Chryseobacterium arthrosphaerae TaxID=651561 RepID=A0A1B8ZAX0_9FLAO|nr:DUF4251 domain-containing protein [Chryseobacterium arthrosphaerae]MDG4650724.1 DUF4251 domain-containing protein [Chryseobacterium arthrosphaerae]OCA68742.1 hypothetical protein BBI00_21315 [Chryseobacterium arthrosphaerae]QUY55011.1 DUF4251 domain-containing protein [Chryseobacterium arthrosphaerae]WES96164.1 DUF4251 domain-containing protein [Chryseobacterium arthrosphaerae]
MKKYISLLMVFGFLFFFQSCASQGSADSQVVSTLVDSEEFTFHAQRANPTNYDVINVMSSMPNSTMTRMLNLDGSYTIELSKNTLDVALPYFGRLFNPTYGNTSSNSYRFTSKDFTVSKSQNKKGTWAFIIKPNDVKSVQTINIEIFKNGKAFVSMRSNDRQPITYDGYVSKNEEKQEKEKL